MKTIAVALLALLASCANTRTLEETHAVLHDARAELEPILDEFVLLEGDPKLAERVAQASAAADALHVAFEAYLAEPTESGREQLRSALLAATAAGKQILDSIPGTDEMSVRTRLLVRAVLALVNVTARRIGEQPTEAGGASSGAAPGGDAGVLP